jgi:hypothetical protein
MRRTNTPHRVGRLVVATVLGALVSHADVIYVRASAAGANNGTSWADAYTNLQSALGPHAGDQIWVAAGTYIPGNTESFILLGDIALYGGFAGTESSIDERDPAVNITQLSGANVSFHVLRASTATIHAVVDGFIITQGFAWSAGEDRLGGGLLITGGSLAVSNCVFLSNRSYIGLSEGEQNGGDGGAVKSSGGAVLSFTNCRFEGNRAGNGSSSGTGFNGGSGGSGGAIDAQSTSLSLVACEFVDNTAGNAGHAGFNRFTGVGGSGGAIRSRSGTISLVDCTFDGNRSGNGSYNGQDFPDATTGGRGGAVNIQSSTAASTLSHCTFSTNVAGEGRESHGGALYVAASVPITLEDCQFSGNSIGRGDPFAGDGGAVYASGGRLSVLRSTFDGNAAGNGIGGPPIDKRGGNGGAIAATANGPVTISECEFRNNTAGAGTTISSAGFGGDGGAVQVSGTAVSIQTCTFQNNRAGSVTPSGTGGNGGAIDIVAASPFGILNCLVTGNQSGAGTTPGLGGGIRVNANGSNGTVSNVTFAANSTPSSSGGGGVWVARTVMAHTVALQNCVLWQNTAGGGSTEIQQIGGFNAGDTIDYSIVQGLSGALGGTGNLGSDPLFANSSADDFHLAAGSPGIDSGNAFAVPIRIASDLDGQPRFMDDPAAANTGAPYPTYVDRGCYETAGTPYCTGDLDGNQQVDIADLALLLSQFGTSGTGLGGDVDRSGTINLADLTILLEGFGQPCP